MADKKDDLDAVREIVQILTDFPDDDRERILRWTRDKLDMTAEQTVIRPQSNTLVAAQLGSVVGPSPTDIRTFVNQKDPRSGVQLAAVVAYYHQFVAPPDQRRESIVSADLIDACRKADRARPKAPAQVLGDAYRDGLLDRAEGHGEYRLNSVGENLVAMVLPGDESESVKRRTSTRRPAKKRAKNTTRKRNAKKTKKKATRRKKT